MRLAPPPVTRRWLLTLSYDGSAYRGWQAQPDVPTVESTVEETLSVLFSRGKNCLVGQGRTDSGVHALGQTAHVDLPDEPAPTFADMLQAMDRRMHSANRMLPSDIRIVDWRPVPDTFHARFDAVSRLYAYRVRIGTNPIKRGFEHQLPVFERRRSSDSAPLEAVSDWIASLNRMAANLYGEHDFSGFCPPDPSIPHFRCTVELAEWKQVHEPDSDGSSAAPLLEFRIRANRFLRHMVRRLVGTMLDAGGRPEAERAFRELLDPPSPEGRPPKLRVKTAPPQGLFLVKVDYPLESGEDSLDTRQG